MSEMAKLNPIVFPIAVFTFQILLLGLFAGFVEYESAPKAKTAQQYYNSFQDVHVMIFIGFGFLMTFLKKYGFGAVAYNMLLSSITIQFATLLNAWLKQRIEKDSGHFGGDDPSVIKVGYLHLMTADFTAASVLITFGALLGKTTRLQLFIVCIFECVFFSINENIIVHYLHVSDVGGSILVHLFGAYFGLAVAAVVRNAGKAHELEESNYNSDLFAMIGSIFLWIFWPSFNSGPVGDDPERQRRAIVNTYFALASCVVTSFVMSSLVEKKFRFNMVHIQNATLAGGVAVGTSADLMINPWGAILIGIIAAIISVFGYAYLTPFMSRRLKIHDTCGVHNLHGMPAVFAGICGSIAAATIKQSKYPGNNFEGIYPYVFDNTRSPAKQGCYQFAAVVVSFTIAVIGGLITGAVIKALNRPEEELYNDEPEWLVPEPEIEYRVNVGDVKLSNLGSGQANGIEGPAEA